MDAVSPVFQGKRVLVGVTGGIAAYKGAELVRLLVNAGADVHVVMTQAATKFITPLTLETLSGHPVGTEIFTLGAGSSIEHTELGRGIDAAVVAPATADFLGRLAGGLADELLLNVLMASHMPVLLCPAMNVEMWVNPLVQRNVGILKGIVRYRWLEPDEGALACRVVGRGRLPDPPRIVRHLARLLSPQDFAGRRVVVTAGPTREWMDPVRFLSNPSTGRMGYAVAEAAWERGAQVTLVAGPTELPDPEGVDVVHVDTTTELQSAVGRAMAGADVLVMAAAPADWRPSVVHTRKLKKGDVAREIALERTPDVLAQLPRDGAVIVGFAAETGDLATEGREKAIRKRVDLLFANHVFKDGGDTGFASATNAGVILDGLGEIVDEVPLLPKPLVAHRLLGHVQKRLP